MFCADAYRGHNVSNIIQMMTPLSATSNEGLESGHLQPSSLPFWTKIKLGPSSKNFTGQDTLYWKGRKGPKFYTMLCQIHLVHTSAYLSLLFLKCLPFMYKHSNISLFITYAIVSIVPVFLFFSRQKNSAMNMAILTSIGVHRRPQIVAKVIRQAKMDVIIRGMITMQKLQAAVSNEISMVSKPMSAADLVEVTRIFDSLDLSGDGKIQTSELRHILKALGAPAKDETLQCIVNVLDSNRDGNITKDEFITFYSANISFVDTDIHVLARRMFKQFDQDKNGEVTLGEFKEILDKFNVGYTVDEIGDLVNELDEGENGSIGEHEFFNLLENHRYLFQERSLPELK